MAALLAKLTAISLKSFPFTLYLSFKVFSLKKELLLGVALPHLLSDMELANCLD